MLKRLLKSLYTVVAIRLDFCLFFFQCPSDDDNDDGDAIGDRKVTQNYRLLSLDSSIAVIWSRPKMKQMCGDSVDSLHTTTSTSIRLLTSQLHYTS